MLNNLLSIFPSVKKATLKKELISFLKDVVCKLEEINRIKDPLDRIIDFFQLMSIYHDLVDELDKYNKLLSEKELSILKNKIINVGRSDSGMNRTSKGEVVSENNVWLGNIYGLFTFPISSWKENKNSQKGCWGFNYILGIESDRLNPYDVVSLQAKYYVENNVLHLKEVFKYIISELEK